MAVLGAFCAFFGGSSLREVLVEVYIRAELVVIYSCRILKYLKPVLDPPVFLGSDWLFHVMALNCVVLVFELVSKMAFTSPTFIPLNLTNAFPFVLHQHNRVPILLFGLSPYSGWL